MRCPHCYKNLWFIKSFCPFCRTPFTEEGRLHLVRNAVSEEAVDVLCTGDPANIAAGAHTELSDVTMTDVCRVCEYCGRDNAATAGFCGGCGTSLPETSVVKSAALLPSRNEEAKLTESTINTICAATAAGQEASVALKTVTSPVESFRPPTPVSQQKAAMFCRNCGKPVSRQAVACPGCGVPPRSQTNFCPGCGQSTTATQKECLSCGLFLVETGRVMIAVVVAACLLLIGFGVYKFSLNPPHRGDETMSVAARMDSQDFETFEHQISSLLLKDSGGVGGLTAGMSQNEALRVLRADPYNENIFITESDLKDEFKQLLHTLRGHREAGQDSLDAILIEAPRSFATVQCVGLSFINDQLFRVTHIYQPQEVRYVIPKLKAHANHAWNAQAEALSTQEAWTNWVQRIVSPMLEKFVPVAFDYPNELCLDVEPEMVPCRDYKKHHHIPFEADYKVVFHGVSKSAVMHAAYTAQRQNTYGVMESESTVVRADEQRVLVVTHYFLDPVRKHAAGLHARIPSETLRQGVGR